MILKAIYRGKLNGQIMEKMKTKLHSTETHIAYKPNCSNSMTYYAKTKQKVIASVTNSKAKCALERAAGAMGMKRDFVQMINTNT